MIDDGTKAGTACYHNRAYKSNL